MQLVFWIAALMMGLLNSVYLPMNGVVAGYVQSSLLSSLPFYSLGLLTTAILAGLVGDFSQLGSFRHVPPYLYLSGVASACLIFGSTFLIPRLGAGPFFVLFVAGQVVMATVMSHFGLLGLPHDAMTLKKGAGLVLMIWGVALSTLR